MHYTLFDTPWGVAGFALRGERMIGSWLPGQSRDELRRTIEAAHPGIAFADDLAPDWRDLFVRYFAGEPTDFSTVVVDLDDRPPFRRRVLGTLRRIPYGHTTTYGELARRAGSPRGARAVGGAVAANPLPLVVPCHRVLAANRKLGGFSAAGGVALKRRMLALEGARPGPVTVSIFS